ncbi:hypothetical protein [Flavivirga jejuensis]|uniref:Uncharacterized protein n=1 Tax=Flavivirga jejuensis TaxID=870487 RepID=A0ABT8WKA5_9FLAO|nr:hypothetical protein [Flavivirga jejuensis]MDO5973589.1 hypothetical protein [Flavivirga jejuensis]
MKNLTLLMAFILITLITNAQTNTFPTSGNVGIGTTTPDSKLTIQGNVNVGGTSNHSLKTRHITGKEASSTAYDDLFINYNTGKHVLIGFGALDSNIYVSGSIGIGTTNPTYNLHVKGTSYSGLTMESLLGNDNFVEFKEDTNQTFKVGIDSDKSLFKIARTNFNDNSFVVDYTGNVGIGTANPDAELTVKGNIHCEEVLVDLLVPADYVFEKYYEGASTLKADYTMPTLEEVEAYTKANYHLPEVPSAQEMQENGLQLKEMTNLLLQKIEELTLYTIEQEKRIKSLEAKIAQ